MTPHKILKLFNVITKFIQTKIRNSYYFKGSIKIDGNMYKICLFIKLKIYQYSFATLIKYENNEIKPSEQRVRVMFTLTIV